MPPEESPSPESIESANQRSPLLRMYKKDAGAKYGARAMAKLERAPRGPSLKDYLRDSPKLRDHVEQYKKDLVREFKNFAERAKGTFVEKNAEMLVRDMEANFDE